MNRRSFFALLGAAFIVPFLPKKAAPKPVVHTSGYLQHLDSGQSHNIYDPGHSHTVWPGLQSPEYFYQNQGLNRWQNLSI